MVRPRPRSGNSRSSWSLPQANPLCELELLAHLVAGRLPRGLLSPDDFYNRRYAEWLSDWPDSRRWIEYELAIRRIGDVDSPWAALATVKTLSLIRAREAADEQGPAIQETAKS
jgi:hypothetical protein